MKAETPVVAQVEGVTKIYGSGLAQIKALDNISLEIRQGEFVAIMGPSGCGKSTLLHCMAALDRADKGLIKIAGQDISLLSDTQLSKLRRSSVGFIFQSFNLIPILTAGENIDLPFKIAGLKKDSQHKALMKELIQVLGLEERLKHLPNQLSGGQQQRVAVARALVTRPAIIFADEPTGNLDLKAGNDLLQFLSQANQRYKQTIVMVTHSAQVASFAQKVVFLTDGKVVEQLMKPNIDQVSKTLNKIL